MHVIVGPHAAEYAEAMQLNVSDNG
jgi:hypothetical protein